MVKTYLKGNKLCRLAHRVSVAPLLLFPVSATLSAGKLAGNSTGDVDADDCGNVIGRFIRVSG